MLIVNKHFVLFAEVQTEDSMDYSFHEASPSSSKCTLRFKVKAAHDAHVCLSSSDEQDATPIIEVFIGGWDNSKCAIRRDRTKPDRVSFLYFFQGPT
jgi:hypothetical protein